MKYIYSILHISVLAVLTVACTTTKPLKNVMVPPPLGEMGNRQHLPMPPSTVSTSTSPVIQSAIPAATMAQPEQALAPKPTWMQASVNGVYKTGNAYKVNGVWYFPQQTIDPKFDEIGYASWYGQDFHNKMTANGEIFDMNMLSAAHKTLPLPSVVRITNLSNKKSVIVRVNDRGPFSNDRILDVSKKTAELLGFIEQGTTKVRVEVLPEESKTVATIAQTQEYNVLKPQPMVQQHAVTSASSDNNEYQSLGPLKNASNAEVNAMPAPPIEVLESILGPGSESSNVQPLPSDTPLISSVSHTNLKGNIYIQAGAYGNKANAENAVSKLHKLYTSEIGKMDAAGRTLYRVRVGPFPTKQKAQQILKQVIAAGHPDARIAG